jgi:hypothetical protein
LSIALGVHGLWVPLFYIWEKKLIRLKMTIKEWVTSYIKEPKEELIHLIGNLEDIGNKLENSKVTTLLLQ